MRGGQWGSALGASVARGWESRFEEDRRNIHLLLLKAGADPAAVLEYGEYGSALAAAAFWGQKESLKVMIGRVGTQRAIEAFRQSRHPNGRLFESQQEVIKWDETDLFGRRSGGKYRNSLYNRLRSQT